MKTSAVQEHGSEKYGYKDNSFQAAGGFAGIRRLVDCFYDTLEQWPEAAIIRAMHAEDLSLSRDKLTYFLSGWMGGPRYYTEKYGPINIPQVHRHLKIGELERDAWLMCMAKAVEQQPYKPLFKIYLMQQLAIPAERVRITSA